MSRVQSLGPAALTTDAMAPEGGVAGDSELCAECKTSPFPRGAVLGLDKIVRCWYCALPRKF